MKKILFGLVMLLFTSVSAYAGPQDRNLLTVDDAYVDDRESEYGDSEYNGREAYEEHEEHELQGGRYAYRHHGRYSSYRYGDQRENDYNHTRHEAREARARHEAQEVRARHEYDEHHRVYPYGRVNASAGRHRQYYAWMD